MKRFEFNELIEKAFSMGYEIGQKEFGAVKRENKRKKREWEAKEGEKVLNGSSFVLNHRSILKKYDNIVKGNVNESYKAKQRAATRLERLDSRIKEALYRHKYSPDQNLNDLINLRGDAEMDSFYEPNGKHKSNRKQKYVGKKSNEDEKRFYIESLNNSKLDSIKADKMIKEEIKKNHSNKGILDKKNLKRAGLALAGTAAAAGIAYGAKKLYDKKKKKKEAEKEQNKKAED